MPREHVMKLVKRSAKKAPVLQVRVWCAERSVVGGLSCVLERACVSASAGERSIAVEYATVRVGGWWSELVGEQMWTGECDCEGGRMGVGT